MPIEILWASDQRKDWWKFSQGFVNGLEQCGCKPAIVGLHGRDNPKITPEDVARIFRNAGVDTNPS